MAENTGEVKMTPTLGLTGLTMNAMALIAPGAFLWLTFCTASDRPARRRLRQCGSASSLLYCFAWQRLFATPNWRSSILELGVRTTSQSNHF